MRGIEEVESARPPEAQSAIAQPDVGSEVEFLSLQAVLTVKRLDDPGIGLITHQAGRATQPDAATVGQHSINRVARQPLLTRHSLEADGIRRGR